MLRSGGDQFAKRSVAGLPDKSSRSSSRCSRASCKLDDDGAATITLRHARFPGPGAADGGGVLGEEARRRRAGAMTVRDPVVTMVSLPRFLAPGDTAQIGVDDQQSRRRRPATIALKIDRDRRRRASPRRSSARSRSRPAPISTAASRWTADDDRQCRAASRPDRAQRSAHRARLHGRGAAGAVLSAAPLCRPAASPGRASRSTMAAADEFLPGTAEALLTVSPRPDWDVPGLLRALDRYAYGCLEQTTSRALPLLYVDEVASLWRTDPGFSPDEDARRARSATSPSCSARTAASGCGTTATTRCRGSTPMPPIS